MMTSRVVSATAHNYHLSFTQLEQRSKSETVAILVRVFADDLAVALKARFARTVKLSESQIVAKFIAENLVIKTSNGRNIRIFLSKIEPKADVVVVQLTARITSGLRGLKLQQKIFVEHFDDQINQVFIKNSGNESTLDFKRGDSFKVIN